jgi:4-hydroxy-tetrahydrodipicolinate reductase
VTAVCIAGATGWTGRALVEGVLAADDLQLRSGVARSAAGGEIGGAPVFATVADALDGVDVLIDFTSHEVVKDNALTAIGRGVAVVIGTSGLTAGDFEEIDAAARERGVGAVAAGNFSLTAAMAQAAALLVAPHLPHWEVIDYASAAKADVPSGTARELAERLGAVQPSVLGRPLDQIAGPVAARASAAARSTPCGCRASSSPPRSCSGCPTSGSRSATTPARLQHRTSPAHCSRSAPSPDASA